jgi:hypothetical protein
MGRRWKVDLMARFGMPSDAKHATVSDLALYDYLDPRREHLDDRIRCPLCDMEGVAEHGSRWDCLCGIAWVSHGNGLDYWRRGEAEVSSAPDFRVSCDGESACTSAPFGFIATPEATPQGGE